MKLPIYQVDAFTDKLYSGNPAAVVLCKTALCEDNMQAIAAENNLSETAFVVGEPDQLSIRWFTPKVEVDLCGHATLAAAHVLFQLHSDREELIFNSKSGALTVRRDDGQLWLDFPTDRPCPEQRLLVDILAVTGTAPSEIYRGKSDLMAVFADQQSIEKITPNLDAATQLSCRGLIITAPGDEVDFVSRFFAPQSGIDEDPVTGSAHTTLTPYWARRLGKSDLIALQLSSRGGRLLCHDRGQRTLIGGKAITFLKGEMHLQ